MFHQATSPVIRARYQALTHSGGEQGRAAVSSCFLTGSRARGLSCCAMQQGVKNDRLHKGQDYRRPAAIHLTDGLITIHWHTPWIHEVACKMSAELVAIGDPIREVERILWPKGGAA